MRKHFFFARKTMNFHHQKFKYFNSQRHIDRIVKSIKLRQSQLIGHTLTMYMYYAHYDFIRLESINETNPLNCVIVVIK